MKLNHPYKKVTTVTNAASFNTRHLHGDLIAVHVKPATSSTTWRLALVGVNGLSVWDSKDTETGEVNAILWSLTAVNEILTVNLSNTSIDEEFEVEIRVREYQI